MTNRLKEHKAACKLAAFDRSAVAEHAWQEGHEINWNDVEILDTAKDLQERKVKESLYIRMAPKSCLINRDEVRELSPLWIRIGHAHQRNELRTVEFYICSIALMMTAVSWLKLLPLNVRY